MNVSSAVAVTCLSDGVRSRFLSGAARPSLARSRNPRAYNVRQLTYYCFSWGIVMGEASTVSVSRAVAGARANFGVISAGSAATPGPFQAGGTAARQASAPRIPPRHRRRPVRAPARARPCATASATRRPSRVDGRAARTGFLPNPRAAWALAVVSEASAARPTPGRCRARAAAARAPSSGLAAAPRRRGAAA